MNCKSIYFDIVYSYFEDELSEKEKHDFLNELEHNADLKEEYEIQDSINQFLNNREFFQFYKMLQKVESEIKK